MFGYDIPQFSIAAVPAMLGYDMPQFSIAAVPAMLGYDMPQFNIAAVPAMFGYDMPQFNSAAVPAVFGYDMSRFNTTAVFSRLRITPTSVVMAIVLVVFLRSAYYRYLHPLSKVPGPFLASISRLWLVYHALQGQQHLVHMAMHSKYGPIVRIAPNNVMISDPDNFQLHHTFDKADWWLSFRGAPSPVPHGTEQNQKRHNLKKRRVAGGFAMSYVLKNEQAMDDMISLMMEQLSTKFATTGAICDMAKWTYYAAFDIVLNMTFSSPAGFLKQGVDVGGLLASLQVLFNIAQVASTYTVIMKFLHHPWVNPVLAPQPTDKSGPGVLQGLARKAVQERYGTNVKGMKRDVLQSIIDYVDREGEATDVEMLEQEALGPVLAGADTAATAFRTMFLHLSTNSHVRRKFLDQLDSADAQGLLSTPIKYEEVRKHVDYLELVTKETLRIHPVAGAPMYRVVPKGGTVMNGLYVPAGTNIGYSQWQVGRNKEVYGEDVNVFRPERWLEGGETAKRRRDRADVYFGQGAMSCTGKNIAHMELYKVTAELFRRFDVVVVDPTCPFKETNSLAFKMHDFLVQLFPRQTAASQASKDVPS